MDAAARVRIKELVQAYKRMSAPSDAEMQNESLAQAWEQGFSAAIAGWKDRQLNVKNPYRP